MSYCAVVVVAALAAVVLAPGGALALKDLDLALLFSHEEVYQENLLFVDLEADVFRDVWN